MNQSHRQAATVEPGAGPVEGPAWTPGLVSYMTPESESSLYRARPNRRLLHRRRRGELTMVGQEDRIRGPPWTSYS